MLDRERGPDGFSVEGGVRTPIVGDVGDDPKPPATLVGIGFTVFSRVRAAVADPNMQPDATGFEFEAEIRMRVLDHVADELSDNERRGVPNRVQAAAVKFGVDEEVGLLHACCRWRKRRVEEMIHRYYFGVRDRCREGFLRFRLATLLLVGSAHSGGEARPASCPVTSSVGPSHYLTRR